MAINMAIILSNRLLFKNKVRSHFMEKLFSIAEAKNRLPSIIHEVEDGTSVRLTRYGRPVAIIMSIGEYEQSIIRENDFWDELMSYQNRLQQSGIIISDSDFEDLRDNSVGRDIEADK